MRYYDSLDEFWEKNPNGTYFYATSKGQQRHTDVTYPPDAYLLFGKETAGLPEHLLAQHPERCIRIPMREARAVSTCPTGVAVVTYERCGKTTSRTCAVQDRFRR